MLTVRLLKMIATGT